MRGGGTAIDSVRLLLRRHVHRYAGNVLVRASACTKISHDLRRNSYG